MEPLDALESATGEPVTVRLKDGSAYRGALAGFDQHMNVVLEPAETTEDGATGVEDTTIIRGDNVVTINQ
jgi:small nuclear ribonucleoprotein